MDELKLTPHQAYLAMLSFLEAHYTRCKSDEIGSMLGSMSLLSDGSPADPAYAQDWKEAIKLTLEGDVDASLQLSK